MSPVLIWQIWTELILLLASLQSTCVVTTESTTEDGTLTTPELVDQSTRPASSSVHQSRPASTTMAHQHKAHPIHQNTPDNDGPVVETAVLSTLTSVTVLVVVVAGVWCCFNKKGKESGQNTPEDPSGKDKTPISSPDSSATSLPRVLSNEIAALGKPLKAHKSPKRQRNDEPVIEIGVRKSRSDMSINYNPYDDVEVEDDEIIESP